MGTANSELLAQLKTAVTGWTAEVGAAQQRLSQQIDGANTQLDRLLAALQERNGHAAALAAADAEIERLKRNLQQGDLPPGTVTQYSAGPPPRIESVRRELDATVERLHGAIASWTAEVTHSQGDLLNQFNAANTQLQRLLEFLGAPPAGSAAPAAAVPAASLELDQVRHERDVLSDEVRALNIEIETLRREQETFAAANLDAEADRARSQRGEVEALQHALAERDAFIDECQALLEDSQRIEASLSEEIAALEQQVAVYARTEDQLKATIGQQRRESEQHLQALAGLSGEMEALRHALGRDSDSAPYADVQIPDDTSEALAAARGEIERLDASLRDYGETIAHLEGERAAADVAAEALREQIRELESRPDGAAVARLEAQVARLEGLLSEQRQRGTDTIGDARALARDLEVTNRDLAAEGGNMIGLAAIAPEEQVGLEAAMAQLEDELAALRRREEEGVAAARALLQELGAQRDVEAEREAALAAARARIAELEQVPPADVGEDGGLAAELLECRESLTTAEQWIDGLESQLATSEAALAELRSAHEALEAESEVRISEHEATIADLKRELAEKSASGDAETADDPGRADIDGLRAEIARLEEERAAAVAELEAFRVREAELLVERDQIAQALHEFSAKQAAQEEELAEAFSSLEAQQAALRERDETIEAFRQDLAEMGNQLNSLRENESEASRQAEALAQALDGIQASDALHVEELEESRRLLAQMRADHEQQLAASEELSRRGEELERLAQTAQQEEIAALATIEALQSEVHTLQEKEAAENRALEETRAQMAAHQELLREREDKVALLEAQLAEVAAEKETLREATARQEAEMRAAMAEVSEALTERDELREALEKKGEEKGRIYVGEAGMGSGAAEAAAAREQRMRQGDILLSELTHPGDGRSLGDILADAEIITREQLDAALTIQSRDPSQLLGTILVEQEFTTDDAIAQAVACQFNKAVVNPLEVHVQREAIALLNRDICTWHVCIPLRVTGDRLVVAMANPLDESAIYKLRDVSQREITPVVSPASQIMSAIEAHYGTY